jgi:hypothetical protein
MSFPDSRGLQELPWNTGVPMVHGISSGPRAGLTQPFEPLKGAAQGQQLLNVVDSPSPHFNRGIVGAMYLELALATLSGGRSPSQR